MRIMSVDDSKTTRLFIRRAIDVLGFEFIEASDGKEGIEILEREKGNVDLILLDLNMPVMGGMEMLEKMKSLKPYNDIPVTVVSTELERDKIFEAISKGAKNYLIKPFTQEELIGKIMENLNMAI